MSTMSSSMLAYGALPNLDVFACLLLKGPSLLQQELADSFLHRILSHTVELP